MKFNYIFIRWDAFKKSVTRGDNGNTIIPYIYKIEDLEKSHKKLIVIVKATSSHSSKDWRNGKKR